MRLPISLLLLLACSAHGLKFLVYNSLWGRSHITFMGGLAETLVDAGHEVVMLAPIVDPTTVSVGTEKVKKVIRVPPCPSAMRYTEITEASFATIWRSTSMIKMISAVRGMHDIFADQCNATLNHPGLLEALAAEKFDAAITEPMDKCAYSIFEHIGVKSVATTLSIAAFEGSFAFTGLPSFPSYVPGSMMANSEQMTFLQRTKNLLSLSFGRFVMPYMSRATDLVIAARFGPAFPSSLDLIKASSLWFLNNEPLIEFPRPIIHKVIDIGGISVSTGHKPLNQTWSDIMDLRPQTVLLSFGTVAKSFLMPDEYKQSIRAALRQFPDVTFIWKYEKPEHRISEGLANVVETTWVPQNDMLYDPRLSLFITHCGQGSTTEATTAGVPLIVIPVMGDQMRNAAVIRRIGSGVSLEKDQLASPDALTAALRETLGKDEYRERARTTGELIRNRPFSPRETFVRNMEFLGRFGPLRMLDHYGQELGFIQYYLIDVFAFLISVVVVLALGLVMCARLACRRCISRKQKNE